MRILFITSTYLPVTNGVSYQIDILKKAFGNLGHKVFISAPTYPGYRDTGNQVLRYPSLPNPFIKRHPIGIPVFQINKVKKIHPDIVHTHNPLIFGRFAQQISEKLSIPLFFTFHTRYEQYVNYYFPMAKGLTKKLLDSDIRNLSEKCYKVICPSRQIEETLKKISVKNTVVINNSIEDNFFIKPRKKSFEFPKLVFTGRLEKEKNLFFLLKIATELKKLKPDFRLQIIGGGSQLKPIHREVLRCHLENNVSITGETDRNLLPEIYKETHLFITPSLTEVMPLSVIEALACGLPVLALEHSRLEDIVLEKKTGYIMKPDPGLIAQKIVEILNNPGKYKELAENSFKHALNFSIKEKAKEHENLYKEAIRFYLNQA